MRFRLIKIALPRHRRGARRWTRPGDRRARFKQGDSFAELAASNINDDPYLRRNQGWLTWSTSRRKTRHGRDHEPRWIQRGTLGRLEAVEKAVFDLNKPGELTDSSTSATRLYVAKLEEKQGGNARAFDDPRVQEAIRETLMSEQRKKLRDKERQKLLQTAVHRKDEKGLALAVDMAMQKYGVFVRGNASRDK